MPPEQPYGSLDALLEAEIGYTEQTARRTFVACKAKKGRPEKIANVSYLSPKDRAEANQVSLAPQKKIDYLTGRAPELFAQVEAKTLSVRKAYQYARGIEPEPPPC